LTKEQTVDRLCLDLGNLDLGQYTELLEGKAQPEGGGNQKELFRINSLHITTSSITVLQIMTQTSDRNWVFTNGTKMHRFFLILNM
jgi:hypothetical protein